MKLTRRKVIIIAGVLLVVVIIGIVVVVVQSNSKPSETTSKSSPVVTKLKPSTTSSPQTTTSEPDNSSSSQTPNNPTEVDTQHYTASSLIPYIQQASPQLSDASGDPSFQVTNLQQPTAGWYIATILVQGSPQTYRVVLKANGTANNPVNVVAGPGSSFVASYPILPEAVKKALQ